MSKAPETIYLDLNCSPPRVVLSGNDRIGHEIGYLHQSVAFGYASEVEKLRARVAELEAKALLARGEPEQRTYLHLEGYQLANAYEFLGGELETDVTIAHYPERTEDETGETMPAGLYLSYTDYPEEGCVYLSTEERPKSVEPAAALRRKHAEEIEAMRDRTEIYYAEMEAARNKAEDAYFMARPQADTLANRAIFRAGFERAFAPMWNRMQWLPASGEASVDEQARRVE